MPRRTGVVIIGGGVTGTGIARDLALRGADVTLIERDRLAEGTTGRMHGLLHSGARYALSDPESARQCIEENAILRDIASHCIEETGGMFVSLSMDEAGYFEEKREACENVGIPTKEISPETARQIEPTLSEEVERAMLVPDAAIDPFRLVAANTASAEAHGATVLTGHEVVDIQETDRNVTGVTVIDESGSPIRINAEEVVNAAGPWAAKLLSDLDLEVPLDPSKGAMVVTNSRPVDTVINRCRPKGEGDILVPHETTAILGTTDRPIDDPDSFEETQAEVDFLIESIAEMVPEVEDSRPIRAYWGVRPIYDSGAASVDSKNKTRDFAVLDHQERDGIASLTTVLGGKLTTYRLMAERVGDLVAKRIGLDASSRTAEEPLPGSKGEVDFERVMNRFDLKSPIASRTADRLGDKTESVLQDEGKNPVICECEGVTAAEVNAAINSFGPDLGAVRMQTRATMGSCQGGFCAHRLATQLFSQYDLERVREEYDNLLAERWQGQQFVLRGDHLSQVALNRAIRHSSLHIAPIHDSGSSLQITEFDSGPDNPDNMAIHPDGYDDPEGPE